MLKGLRCLCFFLSHKTIIDFDFSFESQLKLPHVPDMIFAQNSLRLVHDKGHGVEFTALDALKCVDYAHETIQVANAKAWKEARY